MNTGYRIRCGQVEDVISLAKLAAETFEATYPDLTKKEVKEYVQQVFSVTEIRAELAHAGIFLLVDSSDNLAGYSHLKASDAPSEVCALRPIELVRLFLVDSAKGRGLGHMLLSKGLRWSSRRGYDSCWLKVWDQNPGAIGFYEKQGFHIAGESQYTTGGMDDRVLLMVKSI
jgi:ribosomal protein S18 acetylase RimI-like enzyme